MRTKKLYFIIPAVLCVFALFALFALWKIADMKWTVRPSENVRSIKLAVMQDDGHYSETLITDTEKISSVRDSVLDLQRSTEVSNIKAVREAETYQKDPRISITLMYDDSLQEICIHKSNVVIFDRRDPNGTYKYLLELDNMSTGELYETLYSLAEPEADI